MCMTIMRVIFFFYFEQNMDGYISYDHKMLCNQGFFFWCKGYISYAPVVSFMSACVLFSYNKPPLNRGTVALPLFVFFSCENQYPFYPF